MMNPSDREQSSTARSVRAGVAAGALGLACAVLLLSACGSSSSATAAQQVCSDRSQLNDAVSTVVNDVRSGDFSKAKDALPAVTNAFDDLEKSVQQLASEQSRSLKPQLDNLRNTVSSLKTSSSLSDLVGTIDSAWNQAKSISQQIGDSLKCS